MTLELQYVLLAFGGVAICVALVALGQANAALRKDLRDRSLTCRQLLDRLMVEKHSWSDPVLPRINAALPPSVKEERVSQSVKEVFDANDPARNHKTEVKRDAAHRKERVKLDLAEEFGPAPKE